MDLETAVMVRQMAVEIERSTSQWLEATTDTASMYHQGQVSGLRLAIAVVVGSKGMSGPAVVDKAIREARTMFGELDSPAGAGETVEAFRG